jgi:O-6-methylguanine DNA methyltransferase
MADNLRALVFQVTSANELTGTLQGWIGLVASDRGLRFLGLPRPSYEAALSYLREYYPDASLAGDDPILLDVAQQVRAYAAGESREFSVELDLQGNSRFALEVWAATVRIPYGQTRTYGWIARQVGNFSPGDHWAYGSAAQAVGAALAANPVPLIIPCHRVIGSDGGLHGFAGGLDAKTRLLAMESGQAALALE